MSKVKCSFHFSYTLRYFGFGYLTTRMCLKSISESKQLLWQPQEMRPEALPIPTFGRMPAWCSFAVHHMWHHLPRTFPNRALQWLCFLAERIRPINAQRRCDNEWSTWFSARGEEEPSGHIRIPTSTWLGWWRGACCSTEAPQDCKCFRSQQATYEINNRNNKLGTGSDLAMPQGVRVCVTGQGRGGNRASEDCWQAVNIPDPYPELAPFPPDVLANFTHNFSRKTESEKYFLARKSINSYGPLEWQHNGLTETAFMLLISGAKMKMQRFWLSLSFTFFKSHNFQHKRKCIKKCFSLRGDKIDSR